MPKPALSVEAIVEAAARISEQEGYEAISMRRLADEFGVTAMALYGYVPTKHHLLELVADRYMAGLDIAEGEGELDVRLTRVFTSMYRLLNERPVLAHVLTEQTVDAPAAYRWIDVGLAILREHGFDDETAVELFKVLASFTVGAVLSKRPRATTKREERERARRLKQLTEYPNLAAVADHYVHWDDALFERGLQQLIRAYTA